jgi:hypothetical protein
MGRLPVALPRTMIAADDARRHAASDAHRAQLTELVTAVAVVEADYACLGPGGIPADSLRQLVVAVTGAAGPGWLACCHHEEAVAAFAALCATPAPPELPVLDQVLAGLLHCRFGPAAACAEP